MARAIESRRPIRSSDVHHRDRERRILFAGAPADLERAAESLRRHGVNFDASSVSTREEALASMKSGGWSLIIADFALGIADADVPVILLINASDEERALETLRNGAAADYVMKDRLGRLGPVAQRELDATDARQQTAFTMGRVAANVAHEFNNILMGIAPFVDVARRATSPQKVESALDQIAAAVKRGRRIGDDIHRLTQPAEPVRAPVDVAALLRAVENETRALLGTTHRLTIESETAWMNADAHQLHQVLVTLILQARDTMIGGGEIALTARRDANHVHFILSDTGRGYVEEALRHAFDPLSAPKRCSAGFGFASARQILVRHGGDISIDSAPGQGTTVRLFVPIANRRHILLVDDDPLVATGIGLLLEAEGYVVTQVSTGHEAIEAAQSLRPDALVLDVGLPDMDGRDVFTAVIAMHPNLPVVFSTGHASGGGFEDVLQHANVRCLMKPYESASLMEALKALIA